MVLQGDRNTGVRRTISERIDVRGIWAGKSRAWAHFSHSANARDTIGSDVIGLGEERSGCGGNDYVRAQLAQAAPWSACCAVEEQRPGAQSVRAAKKSSVLDA